MLQIHLWNWGQGQRYPNLSGREEARRLASQRVTGGARREEMAAEWKTAVNPQRPPNLRSKGI